MTDTPGAASAPGPAQAPAEGGQLRRAAVWMAAGTAASRLTGLLRIIALAYALGTARLADAYNLANTTPNMIYDVVLGGILAATFIPVFVDRLATRPERTAWRAISSVVSVAVVVLVVMTIAFWVLAPEVVTAYTALAHSRSLPPAELARERAVAVTLLRWFVPQVALYGFISLVTALLNTRRRFTAPMWVPIANNVVVIGMLLWFRALVPNGHKPSLATAQAHGGWLLLLGAGTTLGVLLQTLMLVPSLRGIGLGRIRWRWEPGHEAVRTVMRLGGWTFGFVVANQVALYVVLALAVGHAGDVTSYTYAYTFMQVPYAVVAVSVMSAVTPDLAERWATGDAEGFRRRFVGGFRATLAVILPAAMGMLVLSRPAAALLLGHGSTSVGATDPTGAALAMFSLGLPGFCTYLYVVRVLQAMQRTKVAFYLYLLENGVNIVLAVALVGPLGVRGLALSLSVAYSVGAVASVVVLRRWLGALGQPHAWLPLRRAAGATAVMGLVVLGVSNVSGADQGLGLLLRVGAAVLAGGVVYVGIGAILGGRRHPLALLTGAPVEPTPTAASARRDPGMRLGAAWGDSRVPVNTGPRVRILPPPGAPGDDQAARQSRAPRPVAIPEHVRREVGAVRRVSSRPTPAAPRPGDPARGADDQGPPEDDNRDDPGERRWIGGTRTALRPRRLR